MKTKKLRVLLVCSPSEDTLRVQARLQVDARVDSAELCGVHELPKRLAEAIPEQTLRLVLLDDVLFSLKKTGGYLRIIDRMPRTVTGLLLHGADAGTAARENWYYTAFRAHCAGVVRAETLEADAVKTLRAALRLGSAAWPEESGATVPEAAFVVAASAGYGGLMQGRVFNRYIDGYRSFHSMEELLLTLDGLCDCLNFPHRYSIPRTLGEIGRRRVPLQPLNDIDYNIYTPDKMAVPKAPISFCVKITSRADCSMQGRMIGAAGGKALRFDSAEELARLLNAEFMPRDFLI
jgi:hypothetical protein